MRMLNPRVMFPAWLERGPWPYEAGVAMLLIWLAECINNVGAMRATYSPNFHLAHFLADHEGVAIAVCLTGAGCLIVGLSIVAFGPMRYARPFRVVGLLIACCVFGAIATGFHAAWTYSLGGGAYLFLTWRTFCVAVRIAREDDALGTR